MRSRGEDIALASLLTILIFTVLALYAKFEEGKMVEAYVDDNCSEATSESSEFRSEVNLIELDRTSEDCLR